MKKFLTALFLAAAFILTAADMLPNSGFKKIGKNVTVTAIHDVDSFYTDDSVFWDTCGNELGRALFFANGKQNIEFIGEEGNLIDGRGGLWFEGDEKSHNRPSLIRFVNCKNVTLKNLNLIDSPCWCIHIQNCENVLIDGLTIKSYCNHNNDGIDIDGCTNVVVQNCRVENERMQGQLKTLPCKT